MIKTLHGLCVLRPKDLVRGKDLVQAYLVSILLFTIPQVWTFHLIWIYKFTKLPNYSPNGLSQSVY
jgi:hypothetical protein